MKFNTIEQDKLNTMIAVSQVSDEAVDQCLRVFEIMTPYPGKTGTGVDIEKKESFDLALVPNHSMLIQQEVEELARTYRHYYNLEEHMPELTLAEHFNIQLYPLRGAFHKIHADRGYGSYDSRRELVFMTYLNDVHTGGETEFMFHRIKIQPRKGLTLMWPATWTHLHRGLPSPTTEKIICTGWFSTK
jgi:hypothetical protein